MTTALLLRLLIFLMVALTLVGGDDDSDPIPINCPVASANAS